MLLFEWLVLLKDRLVISFEEELVRAHQKTARKNQPPLSVCAFLLERIMPHMDMDDIRLGTREEGLAEDDQEAVSQWYYCVAGRGVG